MAESGMALRDRDARERVARIEVLLEEAETLADPAARELATELVGGLLELYGEGLARLVAHVAEHDGGEIAEALAADELVAHLLLLHGLHPIPLETRVRGALVEVRPYLESHGGNVELLGCEDGVVRLRLEGSCSGCPSSTVTLKLAIERAIEEAAPDVISIEAEGAAAPAPPPGLIQLEMAPPVRGGAPATRAWATAGPLGDLDRGGAVLENVEGEAVLFLRLGGRPYAYRPGCPACGQSLAGGALADAELACPECGARYDVGHAGRGIDAPALHLEPVPLLVEGDGRVKVALGSAA